MVLVLMPKISDSNFTWKASIRASPGLLQPSALQSKLKIGLISRLRGRTNTCEVFVRYWKAPSVTRAQFKKKKKRKNFKRDRDLKAKTQDAGSGKHNNNGIITNTGRGGGGCSSYQVIRMQTVCKKCWIRGTQEICK